MKNQSVVTTQRRGGFKTAILWLVVFCATLNTLVPAFAYGAVDPDSFRAAMSRQPDLLYFFTLSSVPLAIMNDLMDNDAPGETQGGTREPFPDTQSDHHANTSNDCSLARADKGEIARIDQSRKTGGGNGGAPLISAGRHPPCLAPVLRRCIARPIHECFQRGKALFYLLPRSSVNEDAASFPCAMHGIPAGTMTAGIFLCPEPGGR